VFTVYSYKIQGLEVQSPRLSHRQKGYTCAFLSFWDFTMLKFDHMEVSIFSTSNQVNWKGNCVINPD